MNPDPNEFAKAILWRLSGIEAAVIQIQEQLAAEIAELHQADTTEILKRFSARTSKLRRQFYDESIKSVKL